MKSLASVVVCLVLASSLACSQGIGSSGDIRGTVTDPSGALLPKATLTVLNTETGLRRTAMTDSSGQFRVSNLAPATYDVAVQASGFAEAVRKGVVVSIGQTVVSDFQLKVSKVATEIEVASEAAVVETERSSQANNVTERFIADLPIDRRDYLTFTLLMPGVSNSNIIADNADFRVKQTPQSGLSFYGSNGRGNSVTVDGGEANDDSGGVRLTLSQDAVQEFQVNHSNYSADLGGASGAAINIVSKSAGNELHGSLYSYFRNDGLDAADPFAIEQALAPGATFDPSQPDSVGSNVKNSLTRYQYGGSAGFPIKKDKSFLFAAFEGLQQDTQSAVPILTGTNIFRPTTPQQSIISMLASNTGTTNIPCFGPSPQNPLGVNVPPPTCAFLLNNALTISQVPAPARSVALDTFLINQMESNGGLFNYATREYLASGRFDHHLSDSNQFTLTYRYGHDREENPDVHSLTGFTAGSSTRDYENNAMAAWYHQFSATAQNGLRLQFSYTSFDVIPNVPGEVGLQMPGFVNSLGTSIFIPNYTIERRYEIGDNFTLIRGSHTMKFGVDELLRGNHTESHTFFPGRFVFGSLSGFLVSPS